MPGCIVCSRNDLIFPFKIRYRSLSFTVLASYFPSMNMNIYLKTMPIHKLSTMPTDAQDFKKLRFQKVRRQ